MEQYQNQTTLRPYQIEGIKFLSSSRRNILTDDPGLGKTVQALMSIKNQQPCLVVCPKSVKGVWENEVKKWRPDLTPVVLSGRGSFHRMPDSGEVLIVNPDILPENVAMLGSRSNMRLLVDEAHMYKSVKTLRNRKLQKISLTTYALGGSVSFLTGTPLTKDPSDLWGILAAINLIPETYGTFSKFCIMFRGVMTPIGMKWGQPRADAMNPLRPFMFGRRRTEVAKDIPPKSYEVVTVEVPTKLVDNIDVSEEQLEEALGKGQPMLHLSSWRKAIALEKAKQALSFVEDLTESEPVVVFSAHKDSAEIFGKKPGWGLITGEVPVEERNRLVHDFQDGKLKGIAGTIGAMGVGLTLTRSHRLVMIDRDWNPANNTQAEDRVCRLGQNKGVIITDIVSSSKLDQIISNVLIRKSKLITQTVDTLKV